jgi:hypothetical protein
MKISLFPRRIFNIKTQNFYFIITYILIQSYNILILQFKKWKILLSNFLKITKNSFIIKTTISKDINNNQFPLEDDEAGVVVTATSTMPWYEKHKIDQSNLFNYKFRSNFIIDEQTLLSNDHIMLFLNLLKLNKHGMSKQFVNPLNFTK